MSTRTKASDIRADLDLPFPDLELREHVGRGAHSEVYRGRAQGRQVAVKIQRLSPQRVDHRAQTVQCRRESALLASLSHPAVPEVYDVGIANERIYILMEYIEGESLETRFQSEGSTTSSQVARWALRLLDVLDHVHRRGLVHRDLTPANILFDSDGRLRLIDFGLASRCTQVEGDSDEPALGTLKYAAPEQLGAIDALVDARSDLYSVGVLLYESLAGRPPFTGDSFKALLRQHGGVEPSSLDDLDRTLDPTLVDWIERLLSKDPDDRYANAREAMRVLQARTSLELPPIDDVSEHSEDLLYHHSARETLEEAWQSAQSGGGRTLLVLGEAGVGKSFLVEQFLRDVPPLSVPTALQKAERAGDAPLSVLRRCLSGWLDDLEEKRGDEDMSRIYSGLVDVAERLPASAAPLLPPALRAEVELDTSAGELERNEFHEMVATLFWRFAELAGGAILVVDDLQWLDETARRILRRVTARLDSLPLLLIGISRTEEERDTSSGSLSVEAHSHVETVEIAPLDRAQTRSFVSTYLGSEKLADPLPDLFWTRSKGVTFLIADYMYTMFDSGALQPQWGDWRFDPDVLEEFDLSDTALSFVEARLKRLGDEANSLIEVAAVIGHRVDLSLLSHVCELETSEVLAGIERAVQLNILERDGVEYVFAHDRLQDTLLAHIDEARRDQLHLRVARILDETLERSQRDLYAIASHYLEGGPERAPESAFEALCRAGHAALDSFAPAQAHLYLDRARELAETHASLEFDLDDHEALGTACRETGRLDESRRTWRKALDLADAPERRANIRALHGETYLWDVFKMAPARKQYQHALRELDEPLSSESPLRFTLGSLALFVLGWFVRLSGIGYGTASEKKAHHFRFQLFIYQLGQQIEYWDLRPIPSLLYVLRGFYASNRLGPSEAMVENYSMAAAVLGAIGLESPARWLVDQSRNAAETLERPALVALARNRKGWVLFESGHQLDSERQINDVFGDAEYWLKGGDYNYSCIITIWNLHLRGYAGRAHDWLDRFIRRNKREGFESPFKTGTEMLAQLGDFERAESQLRGPQDLEQAEIENTYRTMLHIDAVAALAHFSRDWSQLEEAIEAWRSFEIRPTALPTYTRSFYVYACYGTLERLHAATGESVERAASMFEELLSDFERAARRHDNLRAHLRVLRGSRERLEGEEARALETWSDAERYALEHDNLWAIYEARLRRARLLRKQEREEMAIDQAEAALQLAKRCDWTPDQRRVLEDFPTLRRTSPSSLETSSKSHISSQSSTRAYLDALLQVSLAASGARAPEEQIREVLREVISILGVERGAVFLHEDDSSSIDRELETSVALDAEDEFIEMEAFAEDIVTEARDRDEPLVLHDPREAERRGFEDMLASEVRSAAAVPLQSQEQCIGILYLDSRLARGVLSTDDLAILEALANHIPVALETIRTTQLKMEIASERRQKQFAETLRTTLTSMNQTLDPSEISDELLSGIADELGFDRGWVAIWDETRLEAITGSPPSQLEDLETLERWCEASGCLEHLRRRETSNYLSGSELADRGDDPAVGDSPEAWLAVPLRTRDQMLGVVVLERDDEIFDEQTRELVETFARQASTALKNVRLATKDSLTGLYNRRFFFQMLQREFERMERYNTTFSIVLLDLDHFKELNDTHGHRAGDRVLQRIADVCCDHLRPNDVMGRYGGEEFVCLLPETNVERARRFAERLRSEVADARIEWEEHPLQMTASFGVAEVESSDDDAETVVERADRALYRAKEHGRDRVERLDPQ